MPIWPGTAPGATAGLPPEVNVNAAGTKMMAGRPYIRLGNVSTPTITVFPAKGKNTGAAVVVFPGGGYQILSMDLEGSEVCDWLNQMGVNCVLLKYRVPDSGPYPKSAAALQDAQRAVGLVRLHAEEWGIDPHRVGVMGFSAGAHLSVAPGLCSRDLSRLHVDCEPELSAQSRHSAHGEYAAHVSSASRGRLHRTRGELDCVFHAIEECQGPCGDAHLRGRRPRIRTAAKRSPHHELAQAGGDVAALDQGASGAMRK
jgi:acetyl esterase/lipase